MTYEEERDEIFNTLMKKVSALDEEEYAAYERGEARGLDSEYIIKEKDLLREYNEALFALKRKYGVD